MGLIVILVVLDSVDDLDSDLKMKPKETSLEFTVNFKQSDISYVSWMDNRIVILMSIFIQELPKQTIYTLSRRKGRVSNFQAEM